MEGDARGQVGGMEMGRGERERLAGESRGWRCGGCGGRRNEDILREEGGDGGERGVVTVPEELKFGFRDEMGGGDGGGEKGPAQASSAGSTNPPAPKVTQPIPTSSASTSSSTSTSAPSPQPTRTIPLPSTAPVPPTQTQTLPPPARQGPVPSDGVPAWVDKAIAALVAALAFMVMRKLLL